MAHFVIANILICCIFTTTVQSKFLDELKQRYDNYEVLRVQIPDQKSAEYMSENSSINRLYDIWAEPRIGEHSDIMVSPENLDVVKEWLMVGELKFSTMIENVQILVDIQLETSITNEGNKAAHPMTWTKYLSLIHI